MRPLTNDELIRRAQGGDRAAVNELCCRLYPIAFGLLFRDSMNAQNAEDLAQQVFVVFSKREPYLPNLRSAQPSASQLVSWVCGVARRVWLASRRRAQTTPWYVLGDAELDALAGGEGEPSDEVQTTELAARLRFAVEQLSPPLRDVIIAHHLNGETFQAMSARTGIPPGTLQTRAVRAREELRAFIETSEDGLLLWVDSLSTI